VPDRFAAVADIGGSTVRLALLTPAGETIGFDPWSVDCSHEPEQTLRC